MLPTKKATNLAAFKLSDHFTVVMKPKARVQNKLVKSMTKTKDLRPSNVMR